MKDKINLLAMWGVVVLVALYYEHEGFVFVEICTAVLVIASIILNIKEKKK